jgi:chromate transporter
LAFHLLGLNEILLLFAGASVVLAVYAIRRYRWKSAAAVVGAPLVNLPVIAAGVAGFSQTTLFLSFLKIGVVLYGSGYVLVAFMRSDFVTHLGWLTNQQLLDAIAVGQATPGPVFTIATFAGYLVGSWPGALLATLCIFLSSFVFVALLSRILPWSKKSPWARHFLDGVNVASLCLMAAVTWQLGRDGVVDAFTIVLTVVFLMLVIRFKVNLIWLIIGGAVLGVGWKLLKG